MNENNLQELVNRYESNYALFNNKEHDEIFKWRAVRHFHDTWFSDNKPDNFAALFIEAKKECSILIDNAQVSPTNGIVKLAEQFSKEVESLFRNVLFADDSGDIDLKQNHMEQFLVQGSIVLLGCIGPKNPCSFEQGFFYPSHRR